MATNGFDVFRKTLKKGSLVKASAMNDIIYDVSLPINALIASVISKDGSSNVYNNAESVETLKDYFTSAIQGWITDSKNVYSQINVSKNNWDFISIHPTFIVTSGNDMLIRFNGKTGDNNAVHITTDNDAGGDIHDNTLLTKSMVERGKVKVPVAEKAKNANTLGDVSTNVGSAATPVYFASGKPVPVKNVIAGTDSDDIQSVAIGVSASAGSMIHAKVAGIEVYRYSANVIQDPHMYKRIIGGSSSSSYVYYFPDKSGTIALDSDIQNVGVRRQKFTSISDLKNFYINHRVNILKIVWIKKDDSSTSTYQYEYDVMAVWHSTEAGDAVEFYYGTSMTHLSVLSSDSPAWVTYTKAIYTD